MATAKTTVKTPEFPKFEMPKFDFSKFDSESVMAMHKANVATLVDAHKILVDATEALMRTHMDYVRENLAKMQDYSADFTTQRKPDEYAAEAKAAAERAMQVVQAEVDLGMKAQNDVAELVGKRFAANVEEVKKLAA
ncbi:MAG: phasin family protein [Geminicoccaceae bacterium]